MLRDAGGVSWCQRNEYSCLSLDGLSVLTLSVAGAYTFFKRQQYMGRSRTHSTPLLNGTETQKTISTIRMFKYLGVQLIQLCMLINNVLQALSWFFSNQMNYYFGTIYVADALFWSLCVLVVFLDYTKLQKLSHTIRIIWIIKLGNIIVQFVMISIGYQQTRDDSLQYQLYMQLSNMIALFLLNVLSVFIRSFQEEKTESLPISQGMIFLYRNEVNEEYVVKQYATETRPLFIDQLCKNIKTYDEESSDITDEATRTNTLFPPDEEHQPSSQNHTISFQSTPSFMIPAPQAEAIKVEPSLSSSTTPITSSNTLAQMLSPVLGAEQPFPSVGEEKQLVRVDDYRIYEIRVSGSSIVRKFNKKTTVYSILSKTNDGEAKAQRSFREFRMLYDHMTKMYPYERFPPMPQKKKNHELIDESEVKAREQQFTIILQYYANKGFVPEILRSFIAQRRSRRESSQSNISDTKPNEMPQTPTVSKPTPPLEELTEDPKMEEVFEEVMRNRFNSLAIKRVINQLKTSPPSSIMIPEEQPPLFKLDQDQDKYEFKIAEVQNRNGVIQYKIEAIVNGKVTASVFRKWKEFKALHKLMCDRFKVQIRFPDDAVEGDESKRRTVLQQYINELYNAPNVRTDQRFKGFLEI